MDKDKLKKHHFWILLGLAFVLIPVVLGGVWMGVAQATEEQAKKVDAEKKKLGACLRRNCQQQAKLAGKTQHDLKKRWTARRIVGEDPITRKTLCRRNGKA